MFARAWGLLGALSAVLVMSGFLLMLYRAGWRPGVPTGRGTGGGLPTTVIVLQQSLRIAPTVLPATRMIDEWNARHTS